MLVILYIQPRQLDTYIERKIRSLPNDKKFAGLMIDANEFLCHLDQLMYENKKQRKIKDKAEKGDGCGFDRQITSTYGVFVCTYDYIHSTKRRGQIVYIRGSYF